MAIEGISVGSQRSGGKAGNEAADSWLQSLTYLPLQNNPFGDVGFHFLITSSFPDGPKQRTLVTTTPAPSIAGDVQDDPSPSWPYESRPWTGLHTYRPASSSYNVGEDDFGRFNVQRH
ncbi:hypothetical protein NPIL_80901 [Nephila pilipes]|uniref:Uncharacterized protein n=1 Tax=Nephila pilipes TaxID=299642 RepID=A0A8X6MDL9_NEPPI|nr:hypothetical protein NPIL_80901 [Nephila pilipes]